MLHFYTHHQAAARLIWDIYGLVSLCICRRRGGKMDEVTIMIDDRLTCKHVIRWLYMNIYIDEESKDLFDDDIDDENTQNCCNTKAFEWKSFLKMRYDIVWLVYIHYWGWYSTIFDNVSNFFAQRKNVLIFVFIDNFHEFEPW